MEIIVNQDHVAEFYRFNQDLLGFVREDAPDEDAQPYISIGRFSGPNMMPRLSLSRLIGSVAMYCLQYMDTTKEPLPEELAVKQLTPTNPEERPKYRELTLAELAYDRYAQFIETRAPTEVRKCGLASVGPVALDIQERAALACGIPVHKIPEPSDEDSPFKAAWLTARTNKLRAWQRIGVVLFLASQTPSNMSEETRAELMQEGQAAIDYLYSRVETFTASELKFAVLLGGAALELTRKELIEDVLKPDSALGRHLFRDERPAEKYRIYKATDTLRAELENLELPL